MRFLHECNNGGMYTKNGKTPSGPLPGAAFSEKSERKEGAYAKSTIDLQFLRDRL